MEAGVANLLSKYIAPGCRADLQAIGRSRGNPGEDGEERRSYQSQVLSVLSEDRIEVSMPAEKGRWILLPLDGEYDLCLYPRDGVYQCYARAVERYKNNSMYVLVLDLISNLRKQQRREYYRFSCALEMDSRQLGEEEIGQAGKPGGALSLQLPLKRSIIADISGGGLRFVADYAYEAQSLILCRYHLAVDGGVKEYNLVGKVSGVRELENREGLFEHKVQYVHMDTAEREEIIKYIFDEERRALRNQKGFAKIDEEAK